MHMLSDLVHVVGGGAGGQKEKYGPALKQLFTYHRHRDINTSLQEAQCVRSQRWAKQYGITEAASTERLCGKPRGLTLRLNAQGCKHCAQVSYLQSKQLSSWTLQGSAYKPLCPRHKIKMPPSKAEH